MCSKLGDPLATEIGKNPLDIVQNHPKPELRDRDVRIQIVAASLNFADALQVQVENLKIGFMITCIPPRVSVNAAISLTFPCAGPIPRQAAPSIYPWL